MAKRNIWPFGKGQPLGERTTYRRTRTVTPSRTKAAPRASKAVTERESKRSESERLAGKLSDAGLKAKLQRHYAKGGTLSEYLAANPAHAARVRKLAASTGFEACVESVKARGGAYDPRAVCAAAGRKKYGKAEFQAMAQAGKRRASKKSRNTSQPETLTRAAMNKLPHALSGQKRIATLDDGSTYTWSHDKQMWERISGRRGRSNPAAGAAEVYEDFHGTPSTQIVEVKSRVHYHEHLAALGKLAYLKVAGVDGYEHTIKDFGGALLCSNEDRNQLFIEGGDQAIELSVFGIKQAHELEILGAVTEIGYRTTKHHLGAEGGKALYFHETGEEGGRAPDLVYRTRDERLEIVGGSYTIEAEGIKN